MSTPHGTTALDALLASPELKYARIALPRWQTYRANDPLGGAAFPDAVDALATALQAIDLLLAERPTPYRPARVWLVKADLVGTDWKGTIAAPGGLDRNALEKHFIKELTRHFGDKFLGVRTYYDANEPGYEPPTAPAQPTPPAVASMPSDNRAALQKWEEVGYDMAGSYPADEHWESVWYVVLGDYEHGIGPFVPGDCLTSDATAAFYRGWHRFKGAATQPEAARAGAKLTDGQWAALKFLVGLPNTSAWMSNKTGYGAGMRYVHKLAAKKLIELGYATQGHRLELVSATDAGRKRFAEGR